MNSIQVIALREFWTGKNKGYRYVTGIYFASKSCSYASRVTVRPLTDRQLRALKKEAKQRLALNH